MFSNHQTSLIWCSTTLVFVLLAQLVIQNEAAPRSVRDITGLDGFGSDSFPPSSRTGTGFLQSLLDMIKRLLGLDSAPVIREDGTVEWVDGGGGGWMARMARTLIQFVESLLSWFNGGNSPSTNPGNSFEYRVRPNSAPRKPANRADNELEREAAAYRRA